jgi:hypothetical protein
MMHGAAAYHHDIEPFFKKKQQRPNDGDLPDARGSTYNKQN